MSVTWKYLLFLEVIYFILPSSSSSFIYQNIEGSLNDAWKFNFTIFAQDLTGVILFCVDSTNNQLMLKAIYGSGIQRKSRYIDMRYNAVSRYISLKQLCGSELLQNAIIYFLIISQKEDFTVTCNNNSTLSWSNFVQTNETKNNLLFPLHQSLVYTTKRLYIMIGNLGPYVGKGNVTIYPLKKEMVGCLKIFYYNDRLIIFTKEGTKFETTCSMKCLRNTCNGGLCIEIPFNNISCDCSLTAFNGPHCRRSLKKYIRGLSNSYKRFNNASYIYFKMTWKQLANKNYCLMEILGRYGSLTLWSNQSHLMMNDYAISVINISEVNFISVNVTIYYLFLKIKYYQSETNFTFTEETKIKVGLSESNKNCEEFEGDYDLHFSSSQLQLIEEIRPKSTKVYESQNSTEKLYLILPLYGIIGLFFICGTLMIILYLKTKRNIEMHQHRFSAISSSTLSKPKCVYSKTGLYYTVQDNIDYDYIEEE